MKITNTKVKDSIHLACAVYSKCSYFLTCDDKFIKGINNNLDNLKHIVGEIKLYNPIDFLRKEMEINVIE